MRLGKNTLDALAARAFQGFPLQGKVLVVGGDPGIADQHDGSPVCCKYCRKIFYLRYRLLQQGRTCCLRASKRRMAMKIKICLPLKAAACAAPGTLPRKLQVLRQPLV